MKYLKTYYQLNESLKDYSGVYNDLREFIISNNLQIEFCKKYDIDLDEWEDYVSGELGYDEEIIQSLLNSEYRLSYSEVTDNFKITKKRKSIDCVIKKSTNNEILDIFDIVGIYSEYEPRFDVIVNNKIVGGSTYKNEYDIYNFDIAILDEYQGGGIFKKLMSEIIEDAKSMRCKTIESQIVNYDIIDYLRKLKFNIYIENDIHYAVLNI